MESNRIAIFAPVTPSYITDFFVKNFVSAALAEDAGALGDVTSLATLDVHQENEAIMWAKETGILAGVQFAEMIFAEIDPKLNVTVWIKDGAAVKKGDKILEVKGPVQSILLAERLVLNCMQRMSGIATQTRKLVNLIESTGTTLLDTRKTTPNFRLPEKWAVLIGGGKNHRIGLYDMILLKDNHIDACGGVSKALNKAKLYLEEKGLDLPIEIEARTIEDVNVALQTGIPDRIMLDNMSIEDMKKAVSLIDNRIKTEASGNMSAETIVAVSETGVDYISMGALTHSFKSLDISLKISK
ncbi:MAG: carboxylating nicotinate-nucleotide diphosphorylase [Cytophagales bacterium]|nr:carboxylating nicotinate-nucleotide diphosphorylase [Cytophagales bacterium]